MERLIDRLREVRDQLHGCESLTVASTDGLILATTHDEARRGEFLAAVTSFLLNSCSRGLEPYRAGECRALDFRGDRQILLVRMEGVDAYLVCVLHPGAHAVNLDEPRLRAVTSSVPDFLHGEEPPRTRRFFLQRDKNCRIPIKHGGVLLGRDPEKCDLVLISPKVAARHCLVELAGDRVVASDLDTEHGTRHNGKRFRDSNVELAAGDRLTLPGARGFTIVAVEAGAPQAAGNATRR